MIGHISSDVQRLIGRRFATDWGKQLWVMSPSGDSRETFLTFREQL
jgi:hypothetical protein